MRRQELSAKAEELRALGHEVTSSWHDDTACGDRDDGHRLSATPEARAAIIARDLADIRDSHAFVAFAEPEGSEYTRGTRHGELGVAYALGKILFLVGEREENLLHWIPLIYQRATWGDLLIDLGGV
jgi:nucleoside 2-deoxyribosyltransferase